MAHVAPFGGLRFAGVPLGQVIAPPFDVISPEHQQRLYDRSPYNIIRLELGREANPYAEAAREYQRWRADGVLKPDEPSFYVYEQRFGLPAGMTTGEEAAGQRYTRRAIIARVELEPWEAGVVLPHEATHQKAKDDRFQLMCAIKANVSPVFGLYDGLYQLVPP